MKTTTRRAIGLAATLALGASVLAGCAGGAGGGSTAGTTLTVQVWADATQAKVYENIFAEYEKKNPGVTVKLDWMDWRVFQDKLNTKFAAGDPPDVFFMVGVWMGEYVARDALLDFRKYSDQLDLSSVDPNVLASTEQNGSLYGVPTGTTAPAFVYNTKIVKDAGLTMPDDKTWSWDDFAAFNKQITAKSGGTYGTGFDISWPATFGTYVRQQGEDLFTADGKLGVSEATVEKYFSMTSAMRADGGYAPAGSLEDAGTSTAESPLGKNFIASQVIPSNLFPDFNTALNGNLALVSYPGESDGKRPGIQVTPTLVWSAAATGKNPAEAAKLVNFLTNDPDSFTERSTLLGVPVNPDVATTVAATLGPDQKAFVDYVLAQQKLPLTPYVLEPAGAGEVWTALTSAATEVEFGRSTPAEAAAKFMSDAQTALANAG